MALTVQVPTVGLANSTEAVKVTNTLTNLSAWANGNIPDTDLQAPNNSVRRLLHEAPFAMGSPNGLGAGDYICGASVPRQSGSTGTNNPTPLWAADAGLSGQPQDFVVSNKTAYCRVRVVLATNTVPLGLNIVIGLYRITGAAGAAGLTGVTFGTAAVGTTITFNAPAASSVLTGESAQFTMPVAGAYALGLNLSGSLAANSGVLGHIQLYGYNA